MTITIPLLTGTIPAAGGGTTCVQANEATLIAMGATLGTCTPSPDSTDSDDGAEIESDLEDPWSEDPLPTTDLCSGGGRFAWAATNKITLTGHSYKDKPGIGTGNYTPAEMEANAKADAISRVMQSCYDEGIKTGVITKCKKEDCKVDCVVNSRWMGKPTILAKRTKIEKYNEGSSSEAWVFTFEIWAKVGINLDVACDCPGSDS